MQLGVHSTYNLVIQALFQALKRWIWDILLAHVRWGLAKSIPASHAVHRIAIWAMFVVLILAGAAAQEHLPRFWAGVTAVAVDSFLVWDQILFTLGLESSADVSAQDMASVMIDVELLAPPHGREIRLVFDCVSEDISDALMTDGITLDFDELSLRLLTAAGAAFVEGRRVMSIDPTRTSERRGEHVHASSAESEVRRPN
jgi:hypothetical protein